MSNPEGQPQIENPLTKEVTRVVDELSQLDREIVKAMSEDKEGGDETYASARPLLIRWVQMYESDYLPALAAAWDDKNGWFDGTKTPLTPWYAENLRVLLYAEISPPSEYLFDKATRLKRMKTN